MAPERYIQGKNGSWPGYCDYDRERQRYEWNGRPFQHETLSDHKLDELILQGLWALAVPLELQLPEGF